MSATEILHEIEALPDDERHWLIERLSELIAKDEADWAKFSAAQLARCYGPEDAIYDEE